MSTLLERFTLATTGVLLAALASIATGGVSAAQCPNPDQLDGGPCCTSTIDNVPLFGNMTQGALDICWQDCGVAFVGTCKARWRPQKLLSTVGGNCGVRQSRLDLMDTSGTVKWSGTMQLVYSRTWLETDPSGAALQVWRFLVNGDLRATVAAGPAPCPLPPCAPAFGNRARFTGYIDYAETCSAAGTVGPVQIAWMLTHACDPIDHAPGFPRAGAFHPGRSYTFVGPAAGFVPAPVVAAEGTAGSGFEAVRRINLPAPGTTGPAVCDFEEPALHSLNPINPLCFCSVGAPLNPQWRLGNLTVGGSCGTSITTPGGPFLPGYLSMSIGSWTVPGTYPGVEDLRWNVGNYDYADPCTGAVLPEVFFGVTTLGGYPALQMLTVGFPAPLPLTFIDQGSSIRAGGGPVMNLPYLTNHVLNLNH